MTDEFYVMRVGSGKERKEGTVEKIKGYAPRTGKSLVALLKEHDNVKMVGMGEAGSVILKALAHAQRELKQEGMDLVATEFALEDSDVMFGDNPAKVISVCVSLQTN